VQVYFPTSERNMTKFDAMSQKGAEYVQPYQHSPIVRIEYRQGLHSGLDNILKEYLTK
jgi:hypothetical protein